MASPGGTRSGGPSCGPARSRASGLRAPESGPEHHRGQDAPRPGPRAGRGATAWNTRKGTYTASAGRLALAMAAGGYEGWRSLGGGSNTRGEPGGAYGTAGYLGEMGDEEGGSKGFRGWRRINT